MRVPKRDFPSALPKDSLLPSARRNPGTVPADSRGRCCVEEPRGAAGPARPTRGYASARPWGWGPRGPATSARRAGRGGAGLTVGHALDAPTDAGKEAHRRVCSSRKRDEAGLRAARSSWQIGCCRSRGRARGRPGGRAQLSQRGGPRGTGRQRAPAAGPFSHGALLRRENIRSFLLFV